MVIRYKKNNVLLKPLEKLKPQVYKGHDCDLIEILWRPNER